MIFALLLLLLTPSLALAAITHIGSLGTAASLNSGQTQITVTTSATLEAGNCAIVLASRDDPTGTSYTGVSDTAGNVWTVIPEHDGPEMTVGIAFTRATNELASGGVITIGLGGGPDRTAVRVIEFGCDAGLEVVGTPQTDEGTGDSPSLAISGLSSAETLFIRAIAQSTSLVTDITVTVGWTTTGLVRADGGGGGGSSARIVGEFLIDTVTGATSDPTNSSTTSRAELLVALREQGAPAARRPSAPIMFQ